MIEVDLLVAVEAFGLESHYIKFEYDMLSEQFKRPYNDLSLCGKIVSHVYPFSFEPKCEDCKRILSINKRLTK